jgi:lon-related putative ATP-dependent protease
MKGPARAVSRRPEGGHERVPGRLRKLEANELRLELGTLPTGAPELTSIVGQDRAREAISFGLEIDAPGYGVVVSGQPSSGRTALVRELVRQAAASREPANDWVYLHNFADARRPLCISLPTGQSTALAQRMKELTDACRNALPSAFESESYESRAQAVLEASGKERESVLDSLRATARSIGFGVAASPMGIVATPLGADGRPLPQEVLAGLPDEMRRPIEERGERVQEAILAALRRLRQLEAQAREAVLGLDREVTRFVIGPILDDLERDYGHHGLSEYLAAVEDDVVAKVEVFKRFAGLAAGGAPDEVIRQFSLERERTLQSYQVNLFVVQGPADGAPVVEERQPSAIKLLGRVEFENQMGVMVTDFLHIRPGAIHRANGGFLVLQAEDVLADPRAWTRLKVALRTGEIGVEDVSENLVIPVAGLVPQPMDLRVKVVLIGRPLLLAMLDALDPDFHGLFKIRAEFEPDMVLDSARIQEYVAFIDGVVQRRCLLPFNQHAMRELIRFGSRLAGRQDRLTARLGLIEDMCTEASTLASRHGTTEVGEEHVLDAVAARGRRSGRLADRIRELIAERRLYVATTGKVEGQVNGLAVLVAGDQPFGLPVRITCRAGAGQQGIVDIERETERSGAIHTKGVLVLAGFLMGTFGQKTPLSFNASLTFEQSYDEVEGDSASAAELTAILTALAEVPARQDVAVTGSVDQLGNIQAVGGVTEKVEGFFDVCLQAGLTGAQGVVVPEADTIDLCLKPDLVDAVAGGRFHVWAASRIEQVLELLTDIPAGERDAEGQYPAGTLFEMVAARLRMLGEAAAPAPRERR